MDDTQDIQNPTQEITQEAEPQSKAQQILQLENMINGYMMDLEKIQSSLKEQSSMLKDALENDAEYATILEKVRTLSKEKKARQDKLMQEPGIALTESKIKDLKGQLKEVREAISDYLQQYFTQSGLRQITGTDGEIREIVTVLKLIKKKV